MRKLELLAGLLLAIGMWTLAVAAVWHFRVMRALAEILKLAIFCLIGLLLAIGIWTLAVAAVWHFGL